MLRTWPIKITHEELFIERYGQLLQWSLKLANGDRQLAEDLVHDAFIQFTLGRPDLDGIQNLDGYLYSTLRNRFLSHVRRSVRPPIDRLSAVDYDSAEISLRTSDPRTVMQVHEELHLICRYACERKATSKAGSVLILRFIHGYFPEEIARIMKGTRQAVDIWIRLARSEARLYVETPRTLRSLESVAARNNKPSNSIVSGDDILNGLRRETLGYRSDDCSPVKRLEEIYRGSETVNSTLLAHIVSCPPCLETVSALLGLAPPADRHPTDKQGPWPPSDKKASPPAQLKTSRRRTEEVLEQNPAKLIVAVNGIFVGAQAVSSELSELTLSIHVDERIGFVDILSEQGLLLLALNVEPPPDGPVEHAAQVELSRGRSMEATLTFLAARPTLQVAYRDPHFLETSAIQVPNAREDELESAQAPLLVAEQAAEATRRSPAPAPAPRWSHYSTLFKLLRRPFNLAFWLRPGVVTATLAVVIAIAVVFYSGSRPVSASQLLNKAEIAERAILNDPGAVIHRSIDLEERTLSSGDSAVRKRLEVWQTSSAGESRRRVLRLYDEKGRLEAGEWTMSDGSRTIYRNGHSSPAGPPIETFPENSDDIWRLDLSAHGFAAIVGDIARAGVDQQPATFVISYPVPVRTGSSALLRASLTISKADFRAVEQRFVVARGDKEVEYLFRESGFERLSTADVSPDALYPGAEMEEQTSANDRAIQSAFTISANGAQPSSLRSPRFFESLRRVESLAARITEFNR